MLNPEKQGAPAPSAAVPTPSAMTRPLDAIAIAVILVCIVTWGFNQVVIKLALPEVPPFAQGSIRSLGASAFVAIYMLVRGIPIFNRDGSLLAGMVVAVLFGIEFMLMYPALQWTTASRATVFLYTMPFFVVLGARWFLPADRLNRSQWLGMLLSFAGVVVAFGVPEVGAGPRQWLGDLMVIGTAIGWAATVLIIKASVLSRVPPEKTMLYQLVISGIMMAAAAILAGERIASPLSGQATILLIYQAFWVVGVTFLAWVTLLNRYSASRLSAFTFLTPIFGVLAGHFVLGDPLTLAFMGAAALVAVGLYLVNRPR
jgi:drug/metabolite transporter (DMT)-like permease